MKCYRCNEKEEWLNGACRECVDIILKQLKAQQMEEIHKEKMWRINYENGKT